MTKRAPERVSAPRAGTAALRRSGPGETGPDRCPRPVATARWLVDAFGFALPGDLPEGEPDPEHTWVELRVGDGSAAVFLWALEGGDAEPVGDRTAPWVYVDDVDAHLARAEASGATVVSPIVQHGFQSYTAADCEGRPWVFAQAPPRG